MMSGRYRWLLTVLRYGLCVAAIVFLVYTVPWHDHIRLHDGAETPLRLLEVTAAGFVVERDGARVTLPPEDIEHVTVRGALVPRIEYGLPSVVLQCDAAGAIWAILLFLPVPLLAAIRLTWMLRVQTVRLSTWDSIKLTFAGNFFNFALPGMTGGDLIKAYYVTRFTKHKTEAVTTIFLDRAVGLASLVLMAGVMIALTHDPQEFADLIVPLAVILGGLALGTVIVYSRRIRRALRLRQLIERLPMTHQLQRIGEATLAMRQHKLLVIGSLILTFILQTIVIISAIVMARALGMHGSFAFFFIYIAIGFVISAVPISPPQAIGVMEFFYVWFFTANELNTASQAFALAVAVRLIQLIWALPGVLVPLLGAHMPKRSELQALEEAKEPTSAVSDS
jgi:uncharacterized protein (TIRG00374 family)